MVSDSEYVILEVKWHVQQWRDMALGAGGPISNIPIWDELLDETEKPGREIQWIYTCRGMRE